MSKDEKFKGYRPRERKEKFTGIPNKFFDHQMKKLDAYEKDIMLVIFRKTYGWVEYTSEDGTPVYKHKDAISISQFVKMTGMAANTVRKRLNALIEKGHIVKYDDGNPAKGIPPTYGVNFNKLYEEKLYKKNKISITNNDFNYNNPGFVYLLKCKNTNIYKIGYSKNVSRRVKQLMTNIPYKLNIHHVIETEDMLGLESYLHDLYEDKRMNGEYFKLDQEDVEYIKSLNYENIEELFDDQKVGVV